MVSGFPEAPPRRHGPKGLRTRAAILAAAGDVLTEQGWPATTTTAIAARAGVGAGTMYQYFRSKQEVLAELVGQWTAGALGQVGSWDPADGRVGLRRLIRSFVDTYAASAPFQAMWAQASVADPQMAALRATLTGAYVERFAEAFAAGQAAGLLDAGPDPVEAARALCAMVDRYCHEVFVLRAADVDRTAAVTLLTDLWSAALKLP